MSTNSCERCGRDLVDPNAQYGWRCEKIIGASPERTIRESLPALYSAGVNASNGFLIQYNLDPSLVDLERFYEAVSKYMLAKSFDNQALCSDALLEAYNALGFSEDNIDPQVFTSDRLSTMYVPLLNSWLENEASGYMPRPPEIVYEPSGHNGIPRNPITDGLRGVGAGFADFYQDTAYTAQETLLHPADTVVSFMQSITNPKNILKNTLLPPGTPLYYAEKLINAYRQDGFYGVGRQYGSQLGEASLMALTEGIAQRVGKVRGRGVEGAGNLTFDNLDDFIYNPEILGEATPEQLYKHLKENGFNPSPLSGGNTKGIPFEQGGGYIIRWGGDRALEYHPGGLNHHGNVPYFRVSSGATGKMWFDLLGNQLSPPK